MRASSDRHFALVASNGWPFWRLLRHVLFRMLQFLLAVGRQKVASMLSRGVVLVILMLACGIECLAILVFVA